MAGRSGGRAGAIAALGAVLCALAGGVRAATAPVAAPVVRPPGGPWLLVNTTPAAPTVTWSGPGLVVVDSPEVVTGRLLRGAVGGIAAAHLLYADRSPDIAGTVWLFVYLRNALTRPLDLWFTVRAEGRRAMNVRYSPAGVAARAPTAQTLSVGERVAAGLAAATGPAFGPAQAVPPGHAATAVWRVGPGQVFSMWWPLQVTGPGGGPVPFSLSVWTGPDMAAPRGGPLPPGPTGVVRTTLAHADASVSLAAPIAGAWAYDLDNDAPAPRGAAAGAVCPPSICLSGEVTTGGGAPFTAAADPLPGEQEPGVDALDAPGHLPALAIWHDGAVLRTGNYGDYGTRLTLHLTAPRGRLLFAAAVPGYSHGIPWAGSTSVPGATTATWQLPAQAPPPGTGYEIVAGAPSATVTTTLTPGAYAPWRIVLWSEPRPGRGAARGSAVKGP